MTTSPFSANLRSTLTVLAVTLRDLGHELPADLVAELDAIDAATRIPNDLLPDAEQAARRWYELHRDGKDPAKDKTVAALLARNRDTTYGLEIGLKRINDDARHAALTDAADGIVDLLRDVVTEAQEHVEEARRHIGPVVTETRVAGLSPDNQRQLARARDAFTRTDLAWRAWVLLANHTGRARWRPGHVEELLALADLDLDDLATLNETVSRARSQGGIESRDATKHSARLVVAHGHRLALADFDEFNERKARAIEEAERQRDAARKQPKGHDGIDPATRSTRAWVEA